MRTLLVLGLLAVSGAQTGAVAEIAWVVSTRPYLEARSKEAESDASLRAICRSANSIELRIGANEQVGKGAGELVRLRFVSDGREAVLQGMSKRSDDYEMTGGTELVTEVSPSNRFFAVILSGQPIKISGPLKKQTSWTGNEISNAVKKFIEACKGS